MATIKVGESHDKPRIWLEGKWLRRAGFDAGSNYDLSLSGNTITLQLGNGDRRVSSKKDGEIPVIDINTTDIVNAIGTADTVCVKAEAGSITITQTHVALMITSRQLVAREGSLFSGGGFLSMAASLAGFNPIFGVEIDPFYADIYERNHPGAACFNSSVEQVPWEDIKAMRPIGVLIMGIPCQPFSTAGEVMGQGVLVDVFQRVIESVTA
jgi:hypothetical protein